MKTTKGTHMGMSRRRALAGLGALGMAASLRPLQAAGDEIIRLNIPGPHLMPFFPLELIPVLGIDRELGVRLAIRHLPSGVLAAEDMLAGNADFAGTGLPILPNFIARHRDIVAIATLSSGAPPYGIVVRKALATKIRSLKDLRGHSVGVPMGSVSTKTYLQLLAEHWVSAHGVRPQEVRWVPITQNYEGVHGALAGEVADAVFCEEPNSGALVREGLGVRIASLYDPGNPVQLAGSTHIRAVLAAAPATLEARPQAPRKMVQMLRRALTWIHEVPREQIPLRLGIADAAQRADIVQALGRLPNFYSRDGRFDPAEIASTRLFMKSVGLSMPAGRDIATVIDARWLR
ncbi:MAG: ABC transporter substrate-binding protein [Thiobacillus sp.]|uniref:ABC transporter substrate-binding protein n=1 Tax=Thiobacillus sp. TaxID=924 RepID=UPI002736AE5E|nr:ABC transporter substrate-binding protein [Thiobacillus sp.]MDP3584322.1 ABC transporter substrate-binding protein [Thiobacillus sp.]